MEVQDGFIVGIFNYCDRWCERCPLTEPLPGVRGARGNGFR